MDMPFIGKWSLATAAGDAVYADPSSGRLMVGTAPAPAQARFNAYGTLASCILQATGGKYVAATAQGPSTTFAATLGRDASPATFAITAGSGNKISVAWQGPPAQAWSRPPRAPLPPVPVPARSSPRRSSPRPWPGLLR